MKFTCHWFHICTCLYFADICGYIVCWFLRYQDVKINMPNVFKWYEWISVLFAWLCEGVCMSMVWHVTVLGIIRSVTYSTNKIELPFELVCNFFVKEYLLILLHNHYSVAIFQWRIVTLLCSRPCNKPCFDGFNGFASVPSFIKKYSNIHLGLLPHTYMHCDLNISLFILLILLFVCFAGDEHSVFL